MTRPLMLLLVAPLLGACTGVATLETAVPDGAEVFEPRLVGTWEIREDSSLESRIVITREGAARYLVRWMQVHGDSTVLLGRLGPLGSRRWVLELSAIADTTTWVKRKDTGDSTRQLQAPSPALMIPVYMHVVIDRADSGLAFAMFNGDSVRAQLRAGRVRSGYAEAGREFSTTLLLTERETRRLNAALRDLADRPGVLIPLPRVGYRVASPSWR